jgi:hypothetical protein
LWNSLKSRLASGLTDIIIFIAACVLSYLQIIDSNIERQRQIASILCLFLAFRAFTKSKMLQMLSDIINTIEEIIRGIGRYLFAFVVFFMITFAISFWLIAHNQVQFDKLPYDEASSTNGLPDYFTFTGSLWVTYTSLLG